METTIWKFSIPLTDEPEVDMPRGAKVLHFAVQGDTPTIWAQVDPTAPIEQRQFHVAGTGHPLPGDDLVHRGTCFHGPFVWHLFEVVEARHLQELSTSEGEEEASQLP